ncbi:hypothetical protein Q6A89_07130, partial [Aliarcobacter skirrowii]|nr:hypothetical protein [Aliarcobacter skirrowii]
DEQRDKIEELLAMGLSVRKIAKLLGYNNHIGLNNPSIKIDIKNLLIESIKKSKESDKIERKIEELLNKNGIENSKELKNTIKSLF